MEFFDIHTHTVHSDGKHDVAYVLTTGQQEGLSVLSITDHNSVGAYKELRNPSLRRKFGGKMLPGVEISTVYKGAIIEIIGYGFDAEKMIDQLPKHVYSFREKQLREAAVNLKAFRQAGVVMDRDFCRTMETMPEALFDPSRETGKFAFLKEIKKHPENAPFFGGTKRMQQTEFSTFFRKMMCDKNHPLFVDQSVLFPTIDEVVGLIHDCDGLAFMAHPYQYVPMIMEEIEKILQQYPLDGLEAYYYDFSEQQVQIICDICQNHNLYVSGGSDFHGLALRPNQIGYGAEKNRLPIHIIKPWLSKVNFI